jgi:hypothetical protein
VTLHGLDYLEPVTLTAYLSFDLVLFGAWGGDLAGKEGRFRVVGNGQRLLDTTFSNWSSLPQTYPDDIPGGPFPAGTGALQFEELGLSVYHFDFRFDLDILFPPFCCTDVTVDFVHDFPGATGFWGLDNVVVSSIPEPGSAALLALGLAAFGVRGARRTTRRSVPRGQ